MTENERELVERFGKALTDVGGAGFEQLTRFQQIDGIFSIIGYSALVAATVWGFRRVLKWQADEDTAPIKGVVIGILAILFVAFVCGIEAGIVQALVPQGAAIREILGALK